MVGAHSRRRLPFSPPAGAEAVPHPASPASGGGDFPTALRPPVSGMASPFHTRFVPSSPSPAPGSGTLIRASCAPAPAPAGARYAPARCARLIARARPHARGSRKAHVFRWPNRGLFCAGADARGSSLRMAPPSASCGPGVPACQVIERHIPYFVLTCNPEEGKSPLPEELLESHIAPAPSIVTPASEPGSSTALEVRRGLGGLGPGSPPDRGPGQAAGAASGVTRGACRPGLLNCHPGPRAGVHP